MSTKTERVYIPDCYGPKVDAMLTERTGRLIAITAAHTSERNVLVLAVFFVSRVTGDPYHAANFHLN